MPDIICNTSPIQYLHQLGLLHLTVFDLDMAGEYEPWRVPDLTNTRFIRDVYRPRIDLSYVWRDERGLVLAEQREQVSDLAYI